MKYQKLQRFANQLVEYITQGLEKNQIDQSKATNILCKINALLKTCDNQECSDSRLGLFLDKDWRIIRDFIKKYKKK
ncbi:hypothetical protein Sarmat_00595 [Rickettsiales endosymbiont of Paramecium tredecaurelia]|uniref:hypothetical protein n=1 Tax=Candidatus Sarmatiella mevalonica TaxID=2770581 RepID=UPI001924B0F8|nr:hypothetical protein [Candidatus Sarmatiella mevalonica]MBL3284740.1 hypothetical protein [Candidatus Sarmatiella mevalonica]